MANTIRVLIVDDHPVVRNGLSAFLKTQKGITVLGEARDGLEAEDKALELKPDIILMDVYMPRRGGLETVLVLKKKLPQVKVLFLTVSDREADLFQAIRFGGDGYLLKNSGLEEVVDAIRKTSEGEALLSPHMTAKLMKGLREGGDEPALSAREKQVLEMVEEGLTTSEIAKRLFLSTNTVSSYVHRLLEKLHLKNRAEAVAYASRRLHSQPL
jgi:DNA-binding NarL/FixJ family response regulator